MANEINVSYKALVHFGDISRNLVRIRKEVEALNRAEKKANADTLASTKQVNRARQLGIEKLDKTTAANRRQTDSNERLAASYRKVVEAVGGLGDQAVETSKKQVSSNKLSAQSFKDLNAETRDNGKAHREAARDRADGAREILQAVAQLSVATKRGVAPTRELASAQNALNKEFRARTPAGRAAAKAQDELNAMNSRGVSSTNAHIGSLNNQTTAVREATRAQVGFPSALQQTYDALKRTHRETDSGNSTWSRFKNNMRDVRGEQRKLGPAIGANLGPLERFNKGLRRIATFRPRLIPPFIALVPAIAGLLGLMNPLVALLGAAGAATIGFASSLGSLAGAALALPGILSAVAGGISGVIVATGGVGNVFKSFAALKKGKQDAKAASGTKTSEADRAQDIKDANEDIANAQTDLARAYEDAAENVSDAERTLQKAQKASQKAQEDLNDARKEALEDLIALREEVSRAGLDEERAIANLVKAQEEYNNVMADPGSTRGDKLDAAADVKEAQRDLDDTRKDAVKNAADLRDAERKGVEGSDKVVDAREAAADATEAESDAVRDLKRAREDEARTVMDAQRRVAQSQRALRDAMKGDDAAGASNVAKLSNAYQEALDKLSPSAKAFTLGLIAMQGAWESMQRSVQEAFFSQIVDDLDEINGLIPVFGNLWRQAAGAMGEVASNGINMVASGPWTRDFGTIAEQNAGLIRSMGDGAMWLSTAFKDIIIAAGPFTQDFVDRLALGAKNLSDMVAAGRESGAIASYLDGVAGRLNTWWEIIKNIGATLINYGTAASDFGDWLTAGFLEMTQGWQDASEEAKKEGSPFKEWLDDTKPVLHELRLLIGGFFDWFAETASDDSDTGSLKQLESILKTVRTELGPALAELFDTLNKEGIAEGIISVLTSIVELIDDILQNGGSAGFKSFVETTNALLDFLKWIVNLPGAEILIAGIVGSFGVLAGLSFVSTFSGLSAGLGFLLRVAKNGAVKTLLASLGGLGSKALGTLGIGAAGAAGVASKGLKGGSATGAALVPGKAGGVGSAVKGLAGGLKGGVAGAIAGTAATVIAENVIKDGRGGARDTLGTVGVGAAQGAGTGALIGSVIPGVGTAIGAGVGGVVGGALAAKDISPEQWEKSGKEVTDGWNEAAAGLRGWAQDTFGLAPDAPGTGLDAPDGIGHRAGMSAGEGSDKPEGLGENFEHLGTQISDAWNGFIGWITETWTTYVTEPFNTAVDWFQTRWQENVVQPLTDMATNIGAWWDLHVVQPFAKIGVWIGEQWDLYVTQPFNKAVAWFQEQWDIWVTQPFNRAVAWIGEQWDIWVTQPFNRAVQWVRDMWDQYVTQPFNRAVQWVRDMWDQYVTQPFNRAVQWVRDMWTQYVTDPFNAAVQWVKDQWKQYVSDPFNKIVEDIKKLWEEKVTTPFEKVSKDIKDAWDKVMAFFNFGGGGDDNGGSGDQSRGGGSGPAEKKVRGLMAGSGTHVTGTYRSAKVNAAVGGVPNSLHRDKKNPAVDIGGTTAQLDRLYPKLKAAGPWRQLLWRKPGHYDHIHVANKGGMVPGTGRRDTKNARLTPGEFIMTKAATRAIGPENLQAVNEGALGFVGALQAAMGGASGPTKDKQMPYAARSAVSVLDGSGLTSGLTSAPTSTAAPLSSAMLGGSTSTTTTTQNTGTTIEQVVINNPVPEKSGDSIASTLRKLDFLGT
jgi:hypothetical protein